MTPPAGPAAPAPVAADGQLDRIEARLAAIGDELERTRRERDRWRELTHELMPVAQGAMDVASRELEDLSDDVTVEDLVRFARTAARALPRLESLLAQLDSAGDLMHEATTLTGSAVGSLSAALATAEQKGYFVLARGGAAILDELVASVDEADLAALGANVAVILRTVQQLTQPEIMRFLGRAVDDLQTDAGPPPSALGLARRLRDPQVRRGLDRGLSLLRDLGALAPATDAAVPAQASAPARVQRTPEPKD